MHKHNLGALSLSAGWRRPQAAGLQAEAGQHPEGVEGARVLCAPRAAARAGRQGEPPAPGQEAVQGHHGGHQRAPSPVRMLSTLHRHLLSTSFRCIHAVDLYPCGCCSTVLGGGGHLKWTSNRHADELA